MVRRTLCGYGFQWCLEYQILIFYCVYGMWTHGHHCQIKPVTWYSTVHFIFPFVINMQNYTQSKITSKLFQNTLTRMCIAYFKAKNDVCAVATDNFKCTVVS